VPGSDGSLRPWIAQALGERADLAELDTVIDVGAGAGAWLDYLRGSTGQARWVAVEIWPPYVDQFALRQRYDEVIVDDIRYIPLPEAGLYIFGDVIEHMPAEDAVDLWNRARRHCQWLVLSLPVCYAPQGAEYGNPSEVHVVHWDTSSVLGSFAGIVAHTDYQRRNPEDLDMGAFIARGKEP
jgi:hypothetical protein